MAGIESQQERSIINSGKLDRMKKKLLEEALRESQLLNLKTKPMPVLKPSLKRVKSPKCRKCNTGTDLFIAADDAYIEPIDALTMQIKSVKYNKVLNNRIGVNLLRNVLAGAMSALAIHPPQIKMLKGLQRNYPEMPLIFVVDHQCSQLDLLLINFVLLINDLKHPMIVGIEPQHYSKGIAWAVNALSLLKLSVDVSDHLKGHGNVIVSTDGENFSKVLRACESTEAFLVPVSINAERIDENFTLKLFGNESLGIVKLNFNEPYTFKDLMNSDTFNASSLSMTENEAFIISHLKCDIEMKRPIMSTNAVAFFLLTAYRDGATVVELTNELDDFREKHSRIDFAFEGESVDIVEHALEILGNSIHFRDGFVKPNVKEILQLSSYAKPLTPHFALKSILVISALSVKKSEKFIDYNVLLKAAADLCDLLQCELPLIKPCDDINSQLSNAFDQLSLDGIMAKPAADVMTSNEQRARRLALEFEELEDSDSGDDGYQSRNTDNEVTINIDKIKELNALKDVTMAIIEAYLSAAYVLKDCRKFSQTNFIGRSIQIMREEVEDGKSKYWESCSEALMKSCLEWLKLCQIVESDEHKLKVHPDYNDTKSIKFLISRIERFVVL